MKGLQDAAVRDLKLSLMEFYDKTPYELSIEIEGYNSRWEETWRHTRLICTFLYNANPGPEGPVKPYQLMPLPSESLQVALDNYASTVTFQKTMEMENNK